MFNVVKLPASDSEYWYGDNIKLMALEHPGLVLIATDGRPGDNGYYGDVPNNYWAKIVRPFNSYSPVIRRYNPDPATNGSMMADEIGAWLNGAYGQIPRRVIIDELNTATVPDINACCTRMATHQANYPFMKSNWGAFIQAGRGVWFPAWETSLRALMNLRALVVPEFYAKHRDFCTQGADAWLMKFFFTGEDTTDSGTRYYTIGGRFDWLWSLAGQYPGVGINIVFRVSDDYAGGGYPQPEWWIDRQMYNFRQRSSGQLVLAGANGGTGSWKWDSTDPNVPLTNPSRDNSFRDSWNWYCGANNNALRTGAAWVC